MEAEVRTERRYRDGGLGLALIRDCNGPRSFGTVGRYRRAALLRALRTLQSQAGPSPRPTCPPVDARGA
jgi:hypothetical protein